MTHREMKEQSHATASGIVAVIIGLTLGYFFYGNGTGAVAGMVIALSSAAFAMRSRD